MRIGSRPSVLLLVLSLLIVAPVGAAAQTKEDVERAASARDDALATLRTVEAQLDTALLEYHTVNGELEQLTYRITQLVDRVQEYESEVFALRTRAESVVIEAYTGGGRELFDVALNADSIQDILTSKLILELAADSDTTAMGRLEAVRREMERLKEELAVDQARVAELRILAENVVARFDQLQREADAAYELAREEAAAELRAYEEEQARIRAEEARLAALEAARRRGAAGGVDDAVTPGFLCPVPSARFINDWGFPRSGGRTHKGTDMFAARGTPVLAVADGSLRLDTYKLGGIVAFVRADHGVTYYLAHLESYADGIVDGQRIGAGQVIGYVGNTGNAIGTSPHLHIQIHPNHGAAVNPFPTLRRHC